MSCHLDRYLLALKQTFKNLNEVAILRKETTREAELGTRNDPTGQQICKTPILADCVYRFKLIYILEKVLPM